MTKKKTLPKKKALVKLNETFIEVDPAAPKDKDSRVLSDDEVFEVTVFDKLDDALNNDVNRVANKVHREVLQSLERGLRGATLRAIGFEESFGQWRVDHCNGRMSEVSNLLTAETRKVFSEGAEKLIKEDIQSILEEMRPAMQLQLKENIRYHVRQYTNQIMTNMVTDFLTRFMQEEVKKMEPELLLIAKAQLFGKDNASE